MLLIFAVGAFASPAVHAQVSFTSGTTATAMVGDPVSRVVYTATATTTTNTRITYELGTGGNAMMFNINDNTGEVRYNASPTVVSTGFEVIITATDEDDNSANITITVTVNKGDQPDFGFAAPTVRKIPGDANFTVTASGGSGTGTVTYASGDDAIATVDTASGEVTIVAVGITTITATKATDDDYNEATASYVLSVLPVSPRLSAVSRTILPEVARAITDTTVNAITQRLEQAGGRQPPTRRLYPRRPVHSDRHPDHRRDSHWLPAH